MGATSNYIRLEQITHYVIARMPPEQLGAVKLAKILLLADIIAWRDRAQTLTGIEEYRRLPQGPVPTEVRGVLNNLIKRNVIHESVVDFFGQNKKQFVSLIEPNLSDFSGEDVDILNRAMDTIGPLTARQASEASHDVYWQEVPEDGAILISAASVIPAEVDDDDLNWAASELRALGLN